MPFREPNPPSGSSAFVAWCRRVLQAVRANKILPGIGYKVKYTAHGTILEIEPGQGGGTGFDWEGEWDSDTAYHKLAIARVTSIPEGLIGDGKNYTGVWLCVKANTGQRPVWPEPAATEDLYWVMLAMGVREINVSSDNIGSKQMLTSCNDPY